MNTDRQEIITKYEEARTFGRLKFLASLKPKSVKDCLIDFLLNKELQPSEERIVREFLDVEIANPLPIARGIDTGKFKPIISLLSRSTKNSDRIIVEIASLLLTHDIQPAINIQSIDRMIPHIQVSPLTHKKESLTPKKIGVFDGLLMMVKPNLKQLSLYFDEFFVLDIDKWLQPDNIKPVDSSLKYYNQKELRWLLDQEIIKPHNFPFEKELVTEDEFQEDYNKLKHILSHAEFLKKPTSHKNTKSEQEIADFLIHYNTYKSRLQCTYLNRDFQNEAFPILSSLNDLSKVFDDMPKAHVLNVLIKQIPIPSDETPWEQIQEFRRDPDAKEKYLRITQWVNKTSKQAIDTRELAEEIEYLLMQYKQHMDYHKLQHINSSIQRTVIASDESYTHFKTQTSLSSYHQIDPNTTGILATEQNAPGRELAYIEKAKEHFS